MHPLSNQDVRRYLPFVVDKSWLCVPVVGALVLSVALGACGNDELDDVLRELGGDCTLSSDCEDGLVCVFERCHQPCVSSEDCPREQRCVAGDAPSHVCLLDDESSCVFHSDCPPRMLCGPDAQCRDECQQARDCVADQICVERVCAEPDEVSGGAFGQAGEGDPCVLDSECAGDLRCLGGVCGVECRVNADCGISALCNGENRCIPTYADPECVPNAQRDCTCATGGDGVQVCGADGTWGDCVACSGMGGAGGGGGGGTITCDPATATPSAVVASQAEVLFAPLYGPHFVPHGASGAILVGHTNNGQSVDLDDTGPAPAMSSTPLNPFIAWFDTTGTWVGQTHIAVPNLTSVYNVGSNASGQAVMLGSYSQTFTVDAVTVTFSGIPPRRFFMVFDNNRTAAWAHDWVGSATNPTLAAIDSTGDVVVAGMFFEGTDVGGGVMTPSPLFENDIFVAKFDQTTGFLWQVQIDGGADGATLGALHIDANDNIILSGMLEDDAMVDLGGGTLTGDANGDAFIAKWSPTGTHLASAIFAAPGKQEIYALTTNAAGDVVLGATGDFPMNFGGGSIGSVGTGATVARLDANLNHQVSAAGWEGVQIRDLSMAQNGDILVSAGAFVGATAVDECPLTPTTQQAPTLMRIDAASGEAIAANSFATTGINVVMAGVVETSASTLAIASQLSNIDATINFQTAGMATGRAFLLTFP